MLSVLSILRRLYRILKFFVPCFLFCSDDVFSKVHLYAVCCCRSTWNRLAAMLNYPMPAELQSQISIFYVSHSHSADPFLALFCKCGFCRTFNIYCCCNPHRNWVLSCLRFFRGVLSLLKSMRRALPADAGRCI